MFISILQKHKFNSFAAVLGVFLLHFQEVLLIRGKLIMSEVVYFLFSPDFCLAFSKLPIRLDMKL